MQNSFVQNYVYSTPNRKKLILSLRFRLFYNFVHSVPYTILQIERFDLLDQVINTLLQHINYCTFLHTVLHKRIPKRRKELKV